MLICRFCSSKRKNNNSLVNHERLCRENPNRQSTPFHNLEVQQSKKKGNSAIKAKELGIEYVTPKETVDKISNSHKKIWTDDRRANWSETMKIQAQKNIENHPQSYSYKNFCGRAKKSLYKEEWMHSSWELEFAKWADSNNIKWTKKVKSFEYLWNGSIRKYFPDFYLEEFDLYIEVKGYETDRDLEKWKSVSNLEVVKEKDIKAIKEYRYKPGWVS